MDIEIVRPSGHDELLIYLIDEDECRLIATYPFPPASDFPMPELAPGYERAIEARNDVVDLDQRPHRRHPRRDPGAVADRQRAHGEGDLERC